MERDLRVHLALDCVRRYTRRVARNTPPEGRSVCVKLVFWAIRWNEELENPAPEGRTNLAQRFSAGKSGKNELSPGGTTQFSRTLRSASR